MQWSGAKLYQTVTVFPNIYQKYVLHFRKYLSISAHIILGTKEGNRSMYLVKTRAVPFSEEKPVEKKTKRYIPPRYSSKKKAPTEQSAHVKNEDLV